MPLSKKIFLSGKNKTNSSYALFTIVLILVALSSIFFYIIGITGTSFYTWKQESYNTVVVQVFAFNPVPDTEKESTQATDSDDNVPALHTLDKLRKQPFVKKVTLLSMEQILDLSSDWFTNTNILESLNLPSIFTVELSSHSDSALLKETMQELSKDFVISDHSIAIDGVASIFNGLFIASAIILVLIILLIFFVIGSVCRFIVFTEKESIVMLSNLGARDKQISNLLQRKVTFISALGAFFGYSLAVILLAVLFFNRNDLFVFMSLQYIFLILLLGLIIPVFTILLAAFMSYRYSLDSKPVPY